MCDIFKGAIRIAAEMVGHNLANGAVMLDKDFIANKAYDMTQPKEKEPQHNLLDFFSSFNDEHHEDAKSLSIALTKFARWVQSQSDKSKAP